MAKYIPPIMKIYEFENEDIITTSALVNWAEKIEQNNQDVTTAELAKSQLKEFGD